MISRQKLKNLEGFMPGSWNHSENMNLKDYNSKHFSVSFVLLAIIATAGMIPITFVDVALFNFGFSLQWVIIPAIYIYCLAVFRTERHLNLDAAFPSWRFMFILWICWGTILLLIKDYLNAYDSVAELVRITQSFMLVSIVHMIVRTKSDFNNLIRVMKYVYIATILFGLFEVVTGYHLPTSMHFREKPLFIDPAAPTGTFHNINDFASYLVFFLPILTVDLKSIRARIISTSALLAVLYITMISDANINIIAMIMGGVIIYCLYKTYINTRNKAVTIFAILCFSLICVLLILLLMKDNLSSKIVTRFAEEVDLFGQERGSLFRRIEMAKELFLESAKGFFLGAGPKGIPGYSTYHGVEFSLGAYPHNYHIEVLFSYGLIIYGLLVSNYVKLVRMNLKKLRDTADFRILFLIVSICLLPIISLPPSNFIQYQYPWLVFALASISAKKERENMLPSSDIELGS